MCLSFFRSKKVNYSALRVAVDASSDSSEPEAKFHLDLKPCSSRTRRYAGVLLCNALLVALSISATIFYMQKQCSHPRPPQPIDCHCASSVAEAKALNCKYDTLSVSWLPAHCRDDELLAEFDRAGPGPKGSWPYYADKNATVPMTIEEISLLADLPREQAVFYTSTGWHIAHCAFYWRKEFRMRAKGFMTESRYDKESHIEHCYQIFKAGDAMHEVNVASPVWIGGDGADSGHGHRQGRSYSL